MFLRANAGQYIAAAGTRGDLFANARNRSAEAGFADLTASRRWRLQGWGARWKAGRALVGCSGHGIEVACGCALAGLRCGGVGTVQV